VRRRTQSRPRGLGQCTNPISLEQRHGVPAWSHDSLVRVAPLLQQAPNWRRPLVSVIREEELKVLHGHEHTGRPLGDEGFLGITGTEAGPDFETPETRTQGQASESSMVSSEPEYGVPEPEYGVPGTPKPQGQASESSMVSPEPRSIPVEYGVPGTSPYGRNGFTTTKQRDLNFRTE
jgi:hypothetical protein